MLSTSWLRDRVNAFFESSNPAVPASGLQRTGGSQSAEGSHVWRGRERPPHRLIVGHAADGLQAVHRCGPGSGGTTMVGGFRFGPRKSSTLARLLDARSRLVSDCRPEAPLDQLEDRAVLEHGVVHVALRGEWRDDERTAHGTRPAHGRGSFVSPPGLSTSSGKRGGRTWSKKPPHSSYVTMSAVLRHWGLSVSALTTRPTRFCPRRMSACGWSSFELPSSSPMNEGST